MIYTEECSPEEQILRECVYDSLINKGFIIAAGHRGSLSQTGEEYQEFCLLVNLIEVNGDFSPLIKGISAIVAAYGDKGDTVYWRVLPEITNDVFQTKAYFRFLVSHKPIIYRSEEASRTASGLSAAPRAILAMR